MKKSPDPCQKLLSDMIFELHTRIDEAAERNDSREALRFVYQIEILENLSEKLALGLSDTITDIED